MYLRTESVNTQFSRVIKKSMSKTSILARSEQNILNFLTNPNKIYFTGKN